MQGKAELDAARIAERPGRGAPRPGGNRRRRGRHLHSRSWPGCRRASSRWPPTTVTGATVAVGGRRGRADPAVGLEALRLRLGARKAGRRRRAPAGRGRAGGRQLRFGDHPRAGDPAAAQPDDQRRRPGGHRPPGRGGPGHRGPAPGARPLRRKAAPGRPADLSVGKRDRPPQPGDRLPDAAFRHAAGAGRRPPRPLFPAVRGAGHHPRPGDDGRHPGGRRPPAAHRRTGGVGRKSAARCWR